MDQTRTIPAAPRPKSIWPMFIGALVLFVMFAVAVQWMLSSTDRAAFDEEAIRTTQRYDILKKVQEENTALTTGYAWVDRAKGTVRLPLDRAMELAVPALAAAGEPRPAYAVDPNLPLGSAVKPGGLAAPQPSAPAFNAPAPAVAAPPAAVPSNTPAP